MARAPAGDGRRDVLPVFGRADGDSVRLPGGTPDAPSRRGGVPPVAGKHVTQPLAARKPSARGRWTMTLRWRCPENSILVVLLTRLCATAGVVSIRHPPARNSPGLVDR